MPALDQDALGGHITLIAVTGYAALFYYRPRMHDIVRARSTEILEAMIAGTRGCSEGEWEWKWDVGGWDA